MKLDNVQNYSEFLFIFVPLFIILITAIIYELRTGLIRDRLTLPAMLYFLFVTYLWGTLPWWHYLLGLLSVSLLFLSICYVIEEIWESEILGGGALKLLMVVGAAFGVVLALEVAITFILLTAIGLTVQYFRGREGVPTSPFTCCSALLVYILNYWFFGAR